MNKIKLNFAIDIILIILFIMTMISIILEFTSRYHKIFGGLFLLFCVIHIILHWNALLNTIKSGFKKK